MDGSWCCSPMSRHCTLRRAHDAMPIPTMGVTATLSATMKMMAMNDLSVMMPASNAAWAQ